MGEGKGGVAQRSEGLAQGRPAAKQRTRCQLKDTGMQNLALPVFYGSPFMKDRDKEE